LNLNINVFVEAIKDHKLKRLGANNQKYGLKKSEEERVNLKDGERLNYDK
jgi:hypothetical protein